jgi:diguanylate cyclase (GGDEF)-like protein
MTLSTNVKPRPSTATRRAARAWQWLVARGLDIARRRSLIGEILALQLAFAAIVGALALAGLWWASSWVIQDNTRKWGEQWLGNLDELGTPLYVSDDDEKYTRIESYVRKFEEIFFVRYYSAAGEPIFSDFPNRPDPGVPPLDPATLKEIADRPAHDQRYRLDTLFQEIPILRISKPIWTQSLLSDGLLGFDLGTSAINETLVGYVELGLDFSNYQTQLMRTIVTAMLIGIGALLVFTGASWFIYRRALLPLSELQVPLKMLARGKTNFSVPTSGHREIVAIADALNTTVTALNERDKKLSQLANHDALTGLINRHKFSEVLDRQIEEAAQRGSTSALLFIDLDQFKYINDSFGHAAGDRLLKRVADRLVASVREEDIVARFGGDEFIVLLTRVNKKQAATICGTLVQRMQDERFSESGESFNIRCSIGVTMIRGTRLSAAELLTQADMACHHAKSRGRNQFHFYKASSKEVSEMAADAGWSQQIQKALKEDAFVLHYQPIVDIRTRETVYYEVLLRMLLDNQRLVLPSTFLEAANRFGLMVEIDHWVVRHALRSLAELRATDGDIRFTINVSGSTFERPDFFDYVQDHLTANGVPLDAIVLEITEQVAVRNMPAAAKQIAELLKRGCRFAIDDFGAGYCSYSYLKTLPVAFVKIDGSFIGNLGEDAVDQRIVNAISQIAEAAKCETIAEHVKDYETFVLLGELGVDYAQGNFLGKPSAKIKSATLPVPFASSKGPRLISG